MDPIDPEDTEATAMPAELLEVIAKIAEVEAFAEPVLKMLEHVADKELGKKVGEALQLVVNEVIVEPFKPLLKQFDAYLVGVRNERLEFVQKATNNTIVSDEVALALVLHSDLERRLLAEQAKAEIWKMRAESAEKKGKPSSTPSRADLADVLKKLKIH